MNATEMLLDYASRIERILVEFSVNEERAISLLSDFKAELGKKHQVREEGELFEACVYNSLATINTVPNQNKKSSQLILALVEAKEELKAIAEVL